VSTWRVLESYGYKVHEAASAREALEVWRPSAAEVSLLITDMVMPEGISGRDLGERLRAQKPELKVIFMSGYSAEVVGGDLEFTREHESYFLHKPCPGGELIRTVR
jgi:two-component system, cell cycle sensor histidine kinase and response regulator CckA